MNLNDIKLNPDNPRRIRGERLEKLAEYLDQYGDLSGIVYNSNPDCAALVSGHQRMQVFKKGKGAPVILEQYSPPQADGTVARGFIELKNGQRYVYREVHWEKEKADAATIIANGQFGEWDSDMLANAFQFDMPELREMGVPEFVFGGDGIGDGDEEVKMDMPQGDELIGENKNKPPVIKITFPSADDLQRCEAEIQEVINRVCPSAFYSVSAGEV